MQRVAGTTPCCRGAGRTPGARGAAGSARGGAEPPPRRTRDRIPGIRCTPAPVNEGNATIEET